MVWLLLIVDRVLYVAPLAASRKTTSRYSGWIPLRTGRRYPSVEPLTQTRAVRISSRVRSCAGRTAVAEALGVRRGARPVDHRGGQPDRGGRRRGRGPGPAGRAAQPVKAPVSASRDGVTVFSRATARASGTSSMSVPR